MRLLPVFPAIARSPCKTVCRRDWWMASGVRSSSLAMSCYTQIYPSFTTAVVGRRSVDSLRRIYAAVYEYDRVANLSRSVYCWSTVAAVQSHFDAVSLKLGASLPCLMPHLLFVSVIDIQLRSERRKHCTLSQLEREPKTFAPPQTPFPAAQDDQNLISLRWSLPSPTDPVWWRSIHAISSYRGNRPTNKHTNPHTNRQDRLQYTAPLSLARSVTSSIDLQFFYSNA